VAFDDQVGRILAQLDADGLAENTLVIYSSDNGPVLDDAGNLGGQASIFDKMAG
jgi:arylsulfatase A-like enzyme